MENYKNAALIFLNEKDFSLAYNLFILAIEKDQFNSMLWYETGSTLLKVERTDTSMATHAVACLKKSLELDPENEYPKRWMKYFLEDSRVDKENFKRIPTMALDVLQGLKTEIKTEHLIKSFDKIADVDNKIRIVMYLGETGDSTFSGLMRHAIFDENTHVAMASLKRIHYFESDDLEPVFQEIIAKGHGHLEPYFSMSLARIKKPWASDILQQYGAEQFTSIPVEPFITENVKAILINAFSKFSVEDIVQLYDKRDSRTLAYYLISGLNKEGTGIIMQSGIISKTGEFTTAGWDLIQEYIDTAKPAGRKRTWKFWKN